VITRLGGKQKSEPSKPKSLMKITAHHNHITNTLKLHFDAKAKEMLTKSSEPFTAFCQNREFDGLPTSHFFDLLAKFTKSNETLYQFIENDSGQIELSVDDMRNLLEVMLLAANHPDASKTDLLTLTKCSILLATSTPYAVPRIPLPPAVEAFDCATTSPAAWTGYEAVRLWSHSGLPYLSLFDLYEIWTAFQSEPPTDNHSIIFCEWVSHTTLGFRQAFDRFVATKLGPKSTRRRKTK